MIIQLTNTQTGTKQPIPQQQDGSIKLYVCGVTPYDYSHIGHGRVYVTYDMLVRLIRSLGLHVSYVRNVTDIDDKLINKAKANGDPLQFKEIADTFYKAYTQNMSQLGCLQPTAEPRVTDAIPSIIAFISELIDAGHAYVIDGSVYFDIKSFKPYGELSGRDLEDLKAGARVDIDERKRSPFDFALWKASSDVSWESPWGKGRPGWHIECSVMAKNHLGKTVDIHGGGQDLIFPHHENEKAQSEALHKKTFTRLWSHNAFVNINKEKMSKSLGNTVTLNAMFEQHDPMVIRFYYLQHHYKTPLDFAFEDLNGSLTAYKKLIRAFQDIEATAYKEGQSILADSIMQALADDLNSPKAFGLIFGNLDSLKHDLATSSVIKGILQKVFGLSLQTIQEKSTSYTPEVIALIEERKKAREAKNWARADEIRAQLNALGVTLEDKKT